jgi:hypothetical protein
VVCVKGIPMVVAAMGLVIHGLGLFNLIPHPSFITDLFMVCIDSLVVYGLVQKTAWGYWLAVSLYLQQSVMQPGHIRNMYLIFILFIL